MTLDEVLIPDINPDNFPCVSFLERYSKALEENGQLHTLSGGKGMKESTIISKTWTSVKPSLTKQQI